MPKMAILPMQTEYPFSQKSSLPPSDSSVVVRQTVKGTSKERNDLIAKATFIKNLRNKNLVRVQSVLEEDEAIHILYEYVNDKIDWKNEYCMNNVQTQLKQLTVYLSNIGVRTSLSKNRIGSTESGLVKFFLGLNFEWDYTPDQKILMEHYEKQIKKIFASLQKETQIQSLVPYCEQAVQTRKKSQERKVSIATLPSRYNRLIKIDEKLNNIKTSAREFTQQATKIFNNFMLRSQSNEDPRTVLNYPSLKKLNKRIEDRKYSGDTQFSLVSQNRSKIAIKENDSKSEFGLNSSRKICYEKKQESEITNAKARIEEMKSKEYRQIKNSNKNYLQDFLSVLEDDEPVKSISPEKRIQQEETSITVWKDANVLQSKAKQAISNSLKAIKKFKSMGS